MDAITLAENLLDKLKQMNQNRKKQYKDQILQDCFEMGIMTAIGDIADFIAKKVRLAK